MLPPTAYFAPTIIQSLGYGAIRTQLLSVPPWACAFALAMLSATFSDWLRMRYVFVLATTAVSITGFIILLVVHDNRHLQYAALFLAAMGTYSAMPIIVCWFNTNRESVRLARARVRCGLRADAESNSSGRTPQTRRRDSLPSRIRKQYVFPPPPS